MNNLMEEKTPDSGLYSQIPFVHGTECPTDSGAETELPGNCHGGGSHTKL
jgi:hypothetical protein